MFIRFFRCVVLCICINKFLIYNNIPPGWTTLTILVSLIGGAQLLFLGIIGEYIGRIFDEVKDRPYIL